MAYWAFLETIAERRSSIVSAYRKLARIYHPDLNPGEYAQSNFVKLNDAKDILENEVSRLEYDVSISLRGIEEDVIIIDDEGDTILYYSIWSGERFGNWFMFF